MASTGQITLTGETPTAQAALRPALEGMDTPLDPVCVTVADALLIPPAFYYPPSKTRPGKAATGVYDADGAYVRASGSFRGPDLGDAPFGGRPLGDIVQPVPPPLAQYDVAVYGGYLRGHYGHLLLEGLARFWHLLDVAPDLPILVHMDAPDSPGFLALQRLLARLAPLDFDFGRLIPCHGPMRVRELIVPEPALHIRHGVSPRHLEACARLGRSLPWPALSDQPLYLSRAGLTDDARAIVGEAQIEAALARAGVRVLRPETLPFEETIRALRTHTRVLGPVGSAVHGTIFAPGRRLAYVANGIDPRKLRTYVTLDRRNAVSADFLRLTDDFEENRSKTWLRKLCEDRDHPVMIDPDALFRIWAEGGMIDSVPRFDPHERAQLTSQREDAVRRAIARRGAEIGGLSRLRLRIEARRVLRTG